MAESRVGGELGKLQRNTTPLSSIVKGPTVNSVPLVTSCLLTKLLGAVNVPGELSDSNVSETGSGPLHVMVMFSPALAMRGSGRIVTVWPIVKLKRP